MRICLVTPAAAGSTRGNRVTAERWAAQLAELGHRVSILEEWDGEECDLLVALHATKSAPSIERWHERRPGAALIVVLTGTDLYRDLEHEADEETAWRSLRQADRLVALQRLAAEELPESLRAKVRVVIQSAPQGKRRPVEGELRACLLAHVRPVKDPTTALEASRLLPPGSPVRVVHAGGVADRELAARLEREARTAEHYRWLGELERQEARELLASSHLMLITSRSEGGSNVLSEALALGVPVLSTRIPGSVGILGEGYPGYFPVGDAEALAGLLERVTGLGGFYRELERRVGELGELVRPERERETWRGILEELAG